MPLYMDEGGFGCIGHETKSAALQKRSGHEQIVNCVRGVWFHVSEVIFQELVTITLHFKGDFLLLNEFQTRMQQIIAFGIHQVVKQKHSETVDGKETETSKP